MSDENVMVEEKKSSAPKDGKKFEVKKWNAVVLWAWGMFSL